MEMNVEGVSTRKVKEITEELCGTSFSKRLISSLAGTGSTGLTVHRARLHDKALFLFRVFPANERKTQSRRADSNR